MPQPCWNCGAPWKCRRCGSHEQRRNNKGCAECHRTYQRDRHQDDIVITPAIRAYLDAFTRYLMAGKTGDTRLIREATQTKAAALTRLEQGWRP